MRSFRSYTVTLCPALFSWSAQARPAGPDPMIATLFPVLNEGGFGFIHPISKPYIEDRLGTLTPSIERNRIRDEPCR